MKTMKNQIINDWIIPYYPPASELPSPLKTSKCKYLIPYSPRPRNWLPSAPIILPETILLHNQDPNPSDWYPISPIFLPPIIYMQDPNSSHSLSVVPTHSRILLEENAEYSEINLLYGIPFEVGDSYFVIAFDKITDEPEVIYDKIKSIDNTIRLIDSRGYITSDQMDDFPVFKDLKPYFMNSIKDKKTGKTTILDGRPEQRAQYFKWLYNTLMINLYTLAYKTFEEINDSTWIEYDIDLVTKYDVLCQELHGYLTPSIRSKLLKKSISITKETTTAFDTEYQNINFKTNQLLSVQLAVNTKILLKIPVNNRYELSHINTHTQKSYKVDFDVVSSFKWLLCEDSINICINYIRKIKWGACDERIKQIRNKLDAIKTIDSIIKDDSCIYSFPRTAITPFIFYNEKGKGISFEQIVRIANSIGEAKLLPNYLEILEFIKNDKSDLNLEKIKETPEEVMKKLKSINNVIEFTEGYDYKRYQKTHLGCGSRKEVLTVNIKRCNYFVAHLTNADLCMFSDFDVLKEKLSIVQKSFATLGRPLLIDNTDVHIRDTMLLAPAGKRSLGSIGSIHGINKLELSKDEISNMAGLLRKDKKKFTEYAVRDAYITLVHANYMEDFMFKLNNVGIPLTLSSLGGKYVKDIWKQMEYKGYQLNSEYLIGDSSKTLTPKGLFNITGNSDVAYHLPLYISNYKGGRNESFMYGVDETTHWYDYDLTSAYTSVMAFIGNPDYEKASVWTVEELEKADTRTLLYSFTIIQVSEFEFPNGTKFPSIPEYVDDSTTVYALKGEAILMGPEYVLAARLQGCNIKVKSVYHIPFQSIQQTVPKDHIFDSPVMIKEQFDNKEASESESKDQKAREFVNHPFLKVLNDVQKHRREHPKGTIENLLYKEMGNSIYGQVVRGINNKMKYDIQSRITKRMECSDLSNPILASWITAFIRSILGECLHNTHLLGGKIVSTSNVGPDQSNQYDEQFGKIVSVTTDGFITDIDDLESKIAPNSILLKEFQRMRSQLSGNPEALELKHQGKGIISWTTRGQYSLSANLRAATGLQTQDYSKSQNILHNILLDTLKKESKSLEYVQTSLRSAKNIFLDGGHVCPTYRDMVFRMKFDNRRLIKHEEIEAFWDPKLMMMNKSKKSIEDIYNNNNGLWILLDSEPLQDKTQCYNIRFISKMLKDKPYNHLTSTPRKSLYTNGIQLAARNFVKVLLNEELFSKYLSNIGQLNPRSSYIEIQNFLKIFDYKFKMSCSQIEKLKNVNLIDHGVPKTSDTLTFIEFVKIYFPHFKTDLFFKL